MGEQGKDRNKTTPAVMCIKILLQIFNIFYLLVGIAVLGTGIWVKVQLYSILKLTDLDYDNSAYVMIGVGAVILLVAVGGFYCTAKHKIALLYMYAIFIAFLAILQMVAGILGGVYHESLGTTIKGGLEKSIVNKDLLAAWDSVQNTFHCCGINSYLDWNTTIPKSCLKSTRSKRQATSSAVPGTPTLPSSAPVSPTSSPASPTSSPVSPTSSPVSPTSSPASPNPSPASPTSSPASPNSSLASPTSLPASPSSSLASPTSPKTTNRTTSRIITSPSPDVSPSGSITTSADASRYYSDGCSSKITQTATRYLAAIIGVCVGFVFFQILGTVLACCLAKKVGRNNYEQIY